MNITNNVADLVFMQTMHLHSMALNIAQDFWDMVYFLDFTTDVYVCLLLLTEVVRRQQITPYGSLPLMVTKYRKNSKIWDTPNNCHNCPKNRKV